MQVKGAGSFLVYCTQQPQQVLLNGSPCRFQYDNQASRLVVQLTAQDGACNHDLQLSF